MYSEKIKTQNEAKRTRFTSVSNDNEKQNMQKEMSNQESKTESQYKQITFVELRQLKTKELRFKLRQNRGNLKGVAEYLNRFGVKNDRQKKGLTKENIGEMITFTNKNIDVIFTEICGRLKIKERNN